VVGKSEKENPPGEVGVRLGDSRENVNDGSEREEPVFGVNILVGDPSEIVNGGNDKEGARDEVDTCVGDPSESDKEELLGKVGICVDPGIGLDEVTEAPKDNPIELNELSVS
jgi:hypothetical protein